MERTPLDKLFDRVDRLEREVAALKKERREGLTATERMRSRVHVCSWHVATAA
jgi:hypothetical protein